MRKAAILLLGLVLPMLVAAGPATAGLVDDVPPQVDLSGAYVRSGGAATISWVTCNPDGDSTFTFAQRGYGWLPVGPQIGLSIEITVTVGPQERTNPDDPSGLVGDIKALSGTFEEIHTYPSGPQQVPFLDGRGTLRLPEEGASDPLLDERLGTVALYGGCSEDDTSPPAAGLVRRRIEVSTFAAFTLEARNEFGRRYESPGGLASVSFSAEESYQNPYNLVTIGSFSTLLGSTAGFVPMPIDDAASLDVADRGAWGWWGTRSDYSVGAFTGQGKPTDGTRLLVQVDGVVEDRCTTRWGYCSLGYDGPTSLRTDHVVICADNNRNDACDGGEPSYSGVVTWYEPGTPAPVTTPVSPNVPPLDLIDQVGNSAVRLDFGAVDVAGISTVSTSTSPPPAGAPQGFALTDPPRYYDIHTTAHFDGQVEVCVWQPNTFGTQAEYEQQKLLHFINGVWEDITSRVDFDHQHICGMTSSFSPFVVGVADKASDLAIERPADVVVPATGPSGALVNYNLPTVTGSGTNGAPTAHCQPGPESAFAIGTTTVTCTATDDANYTNSPQTSSFTVTVTGATQQLVTLRASVIGVGPGKSLQSKVEAVQAKVAAGNNMAACGGLTGFAGEVSAQAGKKVPQALAQRLLADAERIQAVLSC